jgi:hypothetical protein
MTLSLLSSLVTLCATCSVANAVFNGTDSYVPYLVSIQTFPSNTHHCGGTIISKFHILTAAHCLTKLKVVTENGVVRTATVPREPREFRIVAGEYSLHQHTITKQVQSVEWIWAPTGTLSNPFLADIGLLTLERPLHFNDYVHAVPLPEKGINFTGTIINDKSRFWLKVNELIFCVFR